MNNELGPKKLKKIENSFYMYKPIQMITEKTTTNEHRKEVADLLIYLIYKGEEIIINPRRLVIETHATKNHNKQARKM